MPDRRRLEGPLARFILLLGIAACGGSTPTPQQPPPPPPPPPPAPVVTSVALLPQDTTVDVEASFPLRAEARDAQGNAIPGVALQYRSVATTVAEVGASGTLLADGVGTTTVSAAVGNIKADATIHVKMKIVQFDIAPPLVFAEVYGVNDAGSVVGALYGQGVPQPYIGRVAPTLSLLPTLSQSLVAAQARGINTAGTIAGYSTTADQQSENLVTWTPTGAIMDRGLLGIALSIGVGINDAGQIPFYRGDVASGSFQNSGAVRQPDGTVVPIPPLPVGFGETMPTAISSSGAVVGVSAGHPFIWHAGTGTEQLAGLPDGTFPMAVASGDRVAGYYPFQGTGGNARFHAFLWSPATGRTDLGTLGGTESLGLAMNDAGTIVGLTFTADGFEHAFIWTAAQGMQDLGAAVDGASEARAISASGIVAGLVFPAGLPAPGNPLGPNKPTLWLLTRRH